MKRALFVAYVHTLGAILRALDALAARLDQEGD